jgi:hypothetical protein
MAYTPFVTIEDLIIFLEAQGIGVTLTALQQRSFDRRYNALVSGACQEWERITGYTPFVVASNDAGVPQYTTRRYTNIENGMLDLRTGIVGQPNAVRSLDINGATVNTFTFHPAYCFPQNADTEGKPFTYFNFYDASRVGGWDYYNQGFTNSLPVFVSGGYSVLEVEAYFGYCLPDNVPDLAKNAVLSRACQEPAMASALSSVLASGGVTSQKEGDVEQKWNPELLLKALAHTASGYNATAMLFKRARVC